MSYNQSPIQQREWFTCSATEALTAFGVDPNKGLLEAQAKSFCASTGFNELPSVKDKPLWLLFLEQANNPIIYVLAGAAALKLYFFLSGIDPTAWRGASAIGFVIIFNSVLGFIQESRAKKAIKSLDNYVAPLTRVIRNGVTTNIPSRELVPGDIIWLESGMRIPADARLIESHALSIDESMLTGESIPIDKNADAVIASGAPLGDQINMLFSGTIVNRGRARAVVVATALQTELGKISQSLASTETAKSPLQIKLEQFGHKLTIGVLVVIALLFSVGLMRGFGFYEMLLTSVGLAVSAIPEGLPIAVTITLSFALMAMARRQAVIRRLAAVETLGSCNVICSDKTGTLTQNQMTAVRLYVGDREYEITGTGYSAMGTLKAAWASNEENLSLSPLEWPLRICALCSESQIQRSDDEFSITGDPTEAALMIAAAKLGFSEHSLWKVKIDLPFESERQFMAVTAAGPSGLFGLWKGSSERLLDRCSMALDDKGNYGSFNPELIAKQVEAFSELGFRTLALAFKPLSQNLSSTDLEAEDGLIFAGLVGIVDPPRESAHQAVLRCKAAGIKVVMITGDHVKTAQAIASQLEIARHPKALTGRELEKMSDEELFKQVSETDVYARVSPVHKLRIVKQLQAHGWVAAMTGDGVNDAPSLKQANIGVAMGAGTDVAKEVSSMVILDNNFASIVEAVRRGRVIYDNLQQIILYLITTCLGGVLTIATSVLAGIKLPILPLQLLWVNLVTDGTHTIPLAAEQEHGDAMQAKPRPKNSPLISGTMLRRAILSAVWMATCTLGIFLWSLEIRGGAKLETLKQQLQAEIAYEDHEDFAGYFDEIRAAQGREGILLAANRARLGGLPNEAVDLLFSTAMQNYLHSVSLAFCLLAFFQIFNAQNARSVRHSLFFKLKTRSGRILPRIRLRQNLPLLAVMLFASIFQVLSVETTFLSLFLNTLPLPITDWMIVIGISFSIIVVVEIHKIIGIRLEKD